MTRRSLLALVAGLPLLGRIPWLSAAPVTPEIINNLVYDWGRNPTIACPWLTITGNVYIVGPDRELR